MADDLTTAGRPGSQPPLIPADQLDRLNQRRDAPGLRHLLLHLAVLISGGLLWGLPLMHALPAGMQIPWPLRILGLLLLGVSLAFGFCVMHECGHRTAFASRTLNDAVAWWAGVFSFYNADFYRRYHQWHHRYTHLPGLDPELEDAVPTDLFHYGLELSGLPWWIGKFRSHWAGLWGRFDANPYISPDAAVAVRNSIRCQWAVYALLLLVSLPMANAALLWLWLLPLAVGQPFLRFVLLAEHGGCAYSADGLSNTRTTLTWGPLRWLMWNMSFHSEHHLYPSLPFHALPQAHQLLAPRLSHCDAGYLAVHQGFLRDLSQLAVPPPESLAAG